MPPRRGQGAMPLVGSWGKVPSVLFVAVQGGVEGQHPYGGFQGQCPRSKKSLYYCKRRLLFSYWMTYSSPNFVSGKRLV